MSPLPFTLKVRVPVLMVPRMLRLPFDPTFVPTVVVPAAELMMPLLPNVSESDSKVRVPPVNANVPSIVVGPLTITPVLFEFSVTPVGTTNEVKLPTGKFAVATVNEPPVATPDALSTNDCGVAVCVVVCNAAAACAGVTAAGLSGTIMPF